MTIDVYFKSGETRSIKTKNHLLISDTQYERNSDETTKFMIYIDWSDYSYLVITSITVKIKAEKDVYLFGFPNIQIKSGTTLQCNTSIILPLSCVCIEPSTEIGEVLYGGFTELHEEVDPDLNCPARPICSYNLKNETKRFEGQVLYGCELTFQKEDRINAKYCIIYTFPQVT